MQIEIGRKYRKYDRETIHIRGFVDDQIIMRVWDHSEKHWRYEAISKSLFDWLIERAYMKLVME